MIKTIELSSGIFSSSIDEVIKQTITEKEITRQKLIDIKYSHDGAISYALIIYEE